MKTTRIFAALLSAIITSLVFAGPVMNEGSAQKPADQDAALGTFAGTPYDLDSTAVGATDPMSVVSSASGRTNTSGDLGSLIYNGIDYSDPATGDMPSTAAGIAEPASLALLGAGLIGLAVFRRRR